MRWFLCVVWLAANVAHAQYEGVVPESEKAPTHLLGQPGQSPARVTWPGFQMLSDGGSRVFVQLTSAPQTRVQEKKLSYEVVFKGTALPGSNNRRPLVTEFFNTPVRKAKLSKRKKDVVLTLQLRNKTYPVLSTAPAANGYFFVYLTFPGGDYIPQDQRIEVPTVNPSPEPEQSAPQPPGPENSEESSPQGKTGLDEEKPPVLR